MSWRRGDPGDGDRPGGRADFVRVNQWANAYIANEGFIEGAAAKAALSQHAAR
jgi:predicted TIM-barrel enzyme